MMDPIIKKISRLDLNMYSVVRIKQTHILFDDLLHI